MRRRTRTSWIAWCIITLVLLLLTTIAVGPPLWDIARTARCGARSFDVRVGDTKNDVLRGMGEPVVRVGPGGWGHPDYEERGYGRITEWNWPRWHWPLPYGPQLHILGPNDDDVVVQFDRQGHVGHVHQP